MEKSKAKIAAIRGMHDIMPPKSRLWQQVEKTARTILTAYGFEEARTPIVEPADLFVRSVGESTAIVEKEMYSFKDRNGDLLSLRPEGTASIVRAYIESGAAVNDPVSKYYYLGPMFRYERPQKGRQRQFYQIGVELLGVDSPLADVEVMATFVHFLEELNIKNVTLEINSIGCNECRPGYNSKLVSFLKKHATQLCDDCKKRIEKNPLRVFDCKNESCGKILKDAPCISSFWCGECKDHFDLTKTGLKNLNIEYVENYRIVRGLDYYLCTAFEFTTRELGSQNAVAAGGRYDGLVKDLGGPELPGVGYAIGIERLILLLEKQKSMTEQKEHLVYFAVLGANAAQKIFSSIQMLRKNGIRIEWDFGNKSLKAQMRRADKLGAESVVIVGDQELEKGHVVIRNMRDKSQHEVHLSDLPMHFISIEG